MKKEKGMTERQDTTVTLEETAVQDLTSRLRGTLLRPGDAGYEETRPVYNAMIDKSPALIARCVDVADVIAAVNFAREQKLTLAVRGGGHNGVDLVLADGSFVTANAKEHADLFWAVRGGGGNFGVVTSFLFQLHPISTVYGGPMLWPMEQAAGLMKFWRDFILHAPEEINGWFGFVTVPPALPFPEQVHLQKMCAIVWCYTGPLEQADALFQPIRTNVPPAVDFAGPIPWPVLQSLFDALYPPGLQWYWKADFFTDLSERAIDLHVKYSAQLPTMHSTMHLYPINGAVHRARPSDTAFSFREANFAEVIVGVDPDPANNEHMIQWARDYWMALHPYSAGGGYINMMMDDGADNVKAAYRDNYARLAQLNATYDPSNLFHVNQNIKPGR